MQLKEKAHNKFVMFFLEVGGEPKALAKAGELHSLLEDFRQYVEISPKTIIYRSEF